MPRPSGILAFPEFRGFTRKLILWNLAAFFLLLLLGLALPPLAITIQSWLGLVPQFVLRGRVWQLVTYSFLHQGPLNTVFELLSLWFLSSFLERDRGSRWVAELYFVSVLGAGLAAVALSLVVPAYSVMLVGCYGGIFGLMIAFGVLYAEAQFMMFPLPVMIKAKYLVAVYLLITLASLFSTERVFAFSQLGGALLGYLYIKFGPRRGFLGAGSEAAFGWRNRYYRWKRRRAARKFEVYMRKQNREVHFDKDGRYLDPDERKNPNDRSWMN